MDYQKAGKQIENIRIWMEKAAFLKKKYEKEKIEYIKNIDICYRKKDYDKLFENSLAFQNLVVKKQIPLFNNMINYSQYVLKNILYKMKKECNEESSELNSLLYLCDNVFLDEFKKIQKVLLDQKILFEENRIDKTKGFFSLLINMNHIIYQEKNALKTIVHDVKKIRNLTKKSSKKLKYLIRNSAVLARGYKLKSTSDKLDKLGNNIKLQTAIAASILSIIGISSFFGIHLGIAIPAASWTYKIIMKWGPALVKRDISEAIADIV